MTIPVIMNHLGKFLTLKEGCIVDLFENFQLNSLSVRLVVNLQGTERLYSISVSFRSWGLPQN